MTDYIKLHQQLENVILAQEMWATIPKKNVYLNAWQQAKIVDTPSCGTIACFGGWCALYPAFRAKGVYIDPLGGMPMLDKEDNTLVAEEVARELFGDYDLFDHAYNSINTNNHHGEVSRRLRARRNVLEKALLN
jgi:hypothetical protein